MRVQHASDDMASWQLFPTASQDNIQLKKRGYKICWMTWRAISAWPYGKGTGASTANSAYKLASLAKLTEIKPGRGGIENKHSIDVESPHPPPYTSRECMSVRHEG